MKKIKQYWISFFGLTIFLGLLIGGSVMWMTNPSSIHIFHGPLELVLSEEKNAGDIHLTSILPIADEIALKQSGYTFQLENIGDATSHYTIYLDDIEVAEERLQSSLVKYHFTRNTAIDRIGFVSQLGKDRQRILDTGVLRPGEKHQYQLQFWLSLDAGNEAQGKVFAGKIRVETSASLNSFAE